MVLYFYGNRQQPVSGTAYCRRGWICRFTTRTPASRQGIPPRCRPGRMWCWSRLPTHGACPGGVGVAGQDRADRGRAYLVCDGLRQRDRQCGKNTTGSLRRKKQLHYMGTAQIIMPENYITMFNAPRKEQARSIVEQAEPALQKVLAQVRAGQEFFLH